MRARRPASAPRWIAGSSIAQRGTIDLPAGSLTLRAIGESAGDGVLLESGSVTGAAGYNRVFHAGEQSETAVQADAGAIRLIAGPQVAAAGGNDFGGSGTGTGTTGSGAAGTGATGADTAPPASVADARHDVTIKSGARVDVSAAAAGGNAGTLELSAPAGTVAIGGEIAGAAAAGGEGGRLTLDAGRIAGLSAVVARAGSGGFDSALDLRVREGDLNLAGGDSLRAHTVRLSADTGKIDIAGRIDASGASGGTIALFAGSDLTLRGSANGGRGARLDVHASGAGKDGGSIVLGSSTGTVELATGSSIVLGAGSKGSGGTLLVRAVQNEAHDDVRVARLDSAISGASEVAVEALLRVRRGRADRRRRFVRHHAGHRRGRRRRRGLHGQPRRDRRPARPARPAVAQRRRGAREWRPEPRYALEPGRTAAGRRVRLPDAARRRQPALGQTLSDGFASEVRSADDPNGSGFVLPTPLLDGPSWSYRLIGGADVPAADPLWVKPAPDGATGGDVVVAAQTMVRTGSGSIAIAAGRDLRIESDFASGGVDSASIYTAGRPSITVVENFVDFLAPENGGAPGFSNYANGGGGIDISAQRDVIGAATPYVPSNWLWRFGSTTLDPATGEYPFGGQPAWFPRPDKFRQNVGALAGGNVNVSAGRDVRALSAMIPTTARMDSKTPDASKLVVEGGGDLRLTAGRDIAGGQFLVSRGELRLAAGDTVGAGSTQNSAGSALAPVLLLGDAKAMVAGRQDVAIENVIDPMALPQSEENSSLGGGGNSMFSYTADSQVRVSAVAGNLDLRNEPKSFSDRVRSAPFDPLRNQPTLEEQLVLSPHPGTVKAYALDGDLTLPNGLKLFPAAMGNLELLARGSITLGDSIQMPDFDPAMLPSPTRPGADALAGIDDMARIFRGSPFSPIEHAATPIHAGDTRPVVLMSETGDIVSRTVNYSGVFPKATRIVAGRDLINFHLAAQNLAESDTTRVIAGRDIVFDETRGATGQLIANARGIEVGGPGQLQVSAGRNITLGNSQGIVTRGNLGNPALPETGASISVTVGAQARLDTARFAEQWLDPAKPTSYLPQLAEFLRAETGDASLNEATAGAAFAALPNADQVRFARSVLRLEFARAYLQPVGAPGLKRSYRDEWLKFVAAEGGNPEAPSAQLFDTFATTVLWSELKGTGRDALPEGATPGVYSRGYDALGLLGLAAPFSYNGSLSLFLSQIKTQRGGGIDILAPGGLVNGGATNLPAGFTKGSGDLGIITERGGSIRAMVRDDFLVNQSRVFTLGGGDILIWSSAGNIDAGRGSRTTISAPPPVIRLDPSTGQFIVEYPGAAQGSGIGVLLTRTDIAPGDVDLIAPVGEVNAGDAGIRAAGRVSIAAQRVIGADVIQAGGGISGVPALVPPPPPVPPAPSSADKNVAGGDEAARALAGAADQQRGLSSILTVEVLGLGSDEEDEEEKRKRRAEEEKRKARPQ
ncbi:MAG: filamentous hemagglutinin family protein [Sterolibacteriaceae bacterium]|nr:filamentous hemagglutinin family protein [Sterolibacteriaceae bacterium]